MRAANRACTDAVVETMLYMESPFVMWQYADEVADEAGLSVAQARRAVRHLRIEYNAIEMLPITGAIRLREEGVEAYLECARLYHHERLGATERMRIISSTLVDA